MKTNDLNLELWCSNDDILKKTRENLAKDDDGKL
jgi:hypothetical protein